MVPLTDTLSMLAQAPGAQGQSMMPSLIFFGLMFAAMYFLMIAPQRKKQKEHAKMLAALSSGDEVVTTGGIFGTITNVKDDRFVIRIADNTKIEVGKGFITSVVRKDGVTLADKK
ncbi:preprotein translocase subunit YajC [Horticoccus luteus]|uniref:Sec translocon accessory complex subunit YajC n=2 Tax=Horticoccus luteus TaxID=2862869 RepID=A0A8F9XLK1_9BACT|nr:preprotein translocase subunit YajC [Horticoccus luteus]